MAERINVGGEYETENQDGEDVTRHRYWIEASSSLLNRVTALSVERGEPPNEILGDIVAGRINPDESDESDE